MKSRAIECNYCISASAFGNEYGEVQEEIIYVEKVSLYFLPFRTHSLFVSLPIKVAQINCLATNGGHSLTGLKECDFFGEKKNAKSIL